MQLETSFIHRYLALSFRAFVAVCLIAVYATIDAKAGDMGQPLPSGNQPSPVPDGAGVPSSEWQSATSSLPGKRVKEILSRASTGQEEITTRGRKEIELYKNASPSVVLVVTPNGIGSGSYIGSNQVITNWHVIRDAQDLGVLFKPGAIGKIDPARLVRASIAKVDHVRDLALLKVADVPDAVAPLTFGTNAEVEVGADVHAIGHPTGETWTYTRGIVSQIRPDYEWQTQPSPVHRATVIQTQTPINPGNSGGPLLDDAGRIIGMNSFGATRAQGLNYAVSVDDIRAFLDSPARQELPSKAEDRLCEQERLYEGRDEANTGLLIQFDTNCDAKVDVSLFVPDDTSMPTQALFDTNGDGNIDIIVEDRNRDEKWDISFHDSDFDGEIDLIGQHPDGELAASGYEKYTG